MDSIFQCILGVAGLTFGIVMGALLSWLKKLIEAFVRTVLPDPEKTGEKLGKQAISYFKIRHK
jgi:hypothetical protein